MKTMIFISYKSEDQAIAKPLADWLEAQGYSTWIDVNRLRGGDDWEQKIYTALRQCWALLLICTERTPESEWVRREFEIAHALQIYIVPLNMREGITLPHYVQDLQYIDFSHSYAFGQQQLIGLLNAKTNNTHKNHDLLKLRELMISSKLNLEDLRLICFQLSQYTRFANLLIDDLLGNDRRAKILSLIQLAEQRHGIRELIAVLRDSQPHLDADLDQI